jgi:hypothetical protein
MLGLLGTMLGAGYNPLDNFFGRLDALNTGGIGGAASILPNENDPINKIVKGKIEVPMGPISISMDKGKIAGGRLKLGGDMSIGRSADGWDLNNGLSGIRFNPSTNRFEYYNRGLTVGYGGPDDWRVSQDGPIKWQVGPGAIEVAKDGYRAGYSRKTGPYVKYEKRF